MEDIVASLIYHRDFLLRDVIETHYVALRAFAYGNYVGGGAAGGPVLEVVDEPVGEPVAFGHCAVDHVVHGEHRGNAGSRYVERKLIG